MPKPKSIPVPKPKMISLLERQQFKKWDLKAVAAPKKVLLWMGISVAKFFRRMNDPIKETRIVFGTEMLVCVYPEWWWNQHGDGHVSRQLKYLLAHPEIMEKWVEPGTKEKEPAS